MLIAYFTVLAIIAANVFVIVRGLRKNERLRRAVFSNLDHALEGGYFEPGQALYECTPAEIAYDLSMDAADLDNQDPDKLLVHVRDWLHRRKPT